MKKSLILVLLIVWANVMFAGPANKKILKLNQIDGSTIRLKLFGDEWFHYFETLDGYTVLRTPEGKYVYAERDGMGELISGQVLCHSVGNRSDVELNYLATQSTHLRPSKAFLNQIKSQNPNSMQNFNSGKVTGFSERAVTWNVLVLCIDYPDLTATETVQSFDEMMNQPGYTGGYGATGSFNDYYREVSYGEFGIVADVYGWYRASNAYVTYGNDQGMSAAQLLVAEAVDQAEAAGVDFSKYDNDGDGYVDQVIIVHAGPGAEEAGNGDYIWAHKWNLSATSQTRTYDGVTIDLYTIQAEKQYNRHAGIGMFAHEFGHALGLPDLYDYDGSSEGIGNWGIMGASAWLNAGRTPSHFSPWCKEQLAWVNPQMITTSGQVTFNNIEADPTGVKKIDIPTSTNEYFLLENRQRTGFDSYLPNDGLLIWHIDNSQSDNNDETRKWVDVEEADGNDDLDHGNNRGDAGDIYPGTSGNRDFTDTSYPNSRDNSGNSTSVNIQNISNSAVSMTADVTLSQLATGTLSGRVTDAVSGVPIPDAKVYANNFSAMTDANGEYIIDNITEGIYTIRSKANLHHEYVEENISVSGNTTTTKDIPMLPGTCDPVYVDIADITCSTSNTWTYFAINDVDDYHDVGFGLWYYDTDPNGASFRLETYAKDVVGTKSGNNSYLTPLTEGSEIGNNSNWVTTGEYPDEPFIASSSFTDWNGQTAYVGVKIFMDGFLHYGWFQVQVAADGQTVTLLDYAYNDIPGGTIPAGLTLSNINDDPSSNVKSMVLSDNYPNPFNPSTTISITLPQSSRVNLSVYNLMGQEIRVLYDNEKLKPGEHKIVFDAANLSSGVYFYRLKVHSDHHSSVVQTRKMILLK